MGIRNLAEMFSIKAGIYGGAPAFLVKKEGRYREISWTDAGMAIRYFSLGLKELGAVKGDRIALLSENRPEWACADLGILALGAVNVPLYPTNGIREIEHILEHCEAKILIVSTVAQYQRTRFLLSKAGKLKTIIVMDAFSSEVASGVLFFKDVIEKGRKSDQEDPALFAAMLSALERNDLASIIYTSGTTGEPKGVMLTHGNFLANVEAAAEVLPIPAGSLSLSFLPLSHVFERMAGYYFMLYQGVTIAYSEDMTNVQQNILEIRPHVMTAVPRFYEKIYARVLEQLENATGLKKKIFLWSLRVGKEAMPYRLEGRDLPLRLKWCYALVSGLVFGKIRRKLGGRLKFFISGGAPLPRAIAEFFFAAGILILEGYGLTETSPVVAVNLPGRLRFGTVGPLLPNVEVKIAPDGEILARGPSVMPGYYKDPVRTEEVIREGWFFTGDIGELSQDGFLKITDRKKDIIITSGGKNIAPQKIEGLLVADEYISQICLIGDRRNYLTALIVPDWERLEGYARQKRVLWGTREELAGHGVVMSMIRQRIEARLSDLSNHEKIKYFRLLTREFSQSEGELTPTLKVRRKVIAEKYRDLIDLMYEGKPAGEPVLS
ncbi:MAG TPA: long-chain fatty acid--CoA ligase [Candidatus Omnitrophota bacterium]|nr:long-chain fatty acid--CoA ligase [Candidatus Omnitrophota bacterium]